jgi:uncharacterized protein YndB with AHSA1/START domain
MAVVQRSVVISAQPADVFALMTDTTRFEEWVFGFAGLLEGPETIGADAAYRWRMKGHRLTIRPRSKIIAFDAPRTYTEEVRIPGLVRGTLTKTAVQQKRRTQLVWRLEYRVIGGPAGIVVDKLLAGRVVRRAVEYSLNGAKRVLETPKQAARSTRGGYRRQTAIR